jgi:hypothetical protein
MHFWRVPSRFYHGRLWFEIKRGFRSFQSPEFQTSVVRNPTFFSIISIDGTVDVYGWQTNVAFDHISLLELWTSMVGNPTLLSIFSFAELLRHLWLANQRRILSSQSPELQTQL